MRAVILDSLKGKHLVTCCIYQRGYSGFSVQVDRCSEEYFFFSLSLDSIFPKVEVAILC